MLELDALIAELTGLVGKTGEEDAEYPLPEHEPVKYTNIDVLVMPHGYQHTRTAGESISMDALPLLVSCEIAVDIKAISSRSSRVRLHDPHGGIKLQRLLRATPDE